MQVQHRRVCSRRAFAITNLHKLYATARQLLLYSRPAEYVFYKVAVYLLHSPLAESPLENTYELLDKFEDFCLLLKQYPVVGHNVVQKHVLRIAPVQVQVIDFNILSSYRELTLLVVRRAQLDLKRASAACVKLELNSIFSRSDK